MLPIEYMHKEYGKDESHKCGECDNLGSYTQRRTWYKCERWGRSKCIQSDWRKKWTACGMFNVPLPEGARPLKDCIQRTKAECPPDKNQITLDV